MFPLEVQGACDNRTTKTEARLAVLTSTPKKVNHESQKLYNI